MYNVVEYPADVEYTDTLLGYGIDFIYLYRAPEGVKVYVKLGDKTSPPLDLTEIRAVFSAECRKWSAVYFSTSGRGKGSIVFYVGTETFKTSASVTSLTPRSVSLIRYGRETRLKWVYGNLVDNPGAWTPLVSYSKDAKLWLYGFFLSFPEENTAVIRLTGYGQTDLFIPVPGPGALMVTSHIPLNEGMHEVNWVGIMLPRPGTGTYQAGLLVGEEGE